MKNYIGTNLKALLGKNNLNESTLSKKIGITQQVLNRIVNGVNTNPKLETLRPIAAYFKIPIDTLINVNGADVNNNLSVPFVFFKEISLLGIEAAVDNAKKTIVVDIELLKNKYYFATTMYDDSMEPKFPKGTTLIFEKTSCVVNGDFCLLKDDNNNYVFRQILINSTKKLMKSLNPNNEEFIALPLAVNYFILASLVESRTVFN